MNKRSILWTGIAAASLLSAPMANAAISLYDDGDTSFTTDGYVNVFLTQSDVDKPGSANDRKQARVKMGFLPNYIGFNVAKDTGDLKLGARSSFWVSINDSETAGTSTGIDVRQFYGTVAGNWGEVLIGKDFGLFARANIFNDQILMGYGQASDALGLVDGQGVSFGNIGTGYPYPFPTAQITYRAPAMGGLNVAVGIMDPNSTSDYEEAPRFESEISYSADLQGLNLYGWVNGQYQKSESLDPADEDITSTGVGYGLKASFAGASLTASGFQAEGISPLFTNNFLGLVASEGETEGYLVQGAYTLGDNRFVLSYGENEDKILDQDRDTTTAAVFHSVNANFTLVGEYNIIDTTQRSTGADIDETSTIALGAVLTW